MNTESQNTEKKYAPIMIKQELKDLLDQKMISIGKKMSYSQLITYLILSDNEKK